MIVVKNKDQIDKMKKSGAILSDLMKLLEEHIKPGVSTKELDKIAVDYIKKKNAIPSFLGYNGYPAAICASLNDEVVHGIPSAKRILNEGDIIGIDLGVILNGYHSDCARTFPVGKISEEKAKLIEITRQCFFEGIKNLKDGSRVGDIGYAVQTHAERNGCSVVRELVGHGIGTKLHEPPNVPNYGTQGRGERLAAGMTLAIEPMINLGRKEVVILPDGWTVVTADGSPSGHYENTVVILSDGAEIIT